MRKWISIMLTAAFLVLSVSGLQLAMGQKPASVQQQMSVSHNTDGAAPKGQLPFYPKQAHEWAGFLFIAAGAAHIGLNRRAMLSYVGIKKQ